MVGNRENNTKLSFTTVLTSDAFKLCNWLENDVLVVIAYFNRAWRKSFECNRIGQILFQSKPQEETHFDRIRSINGVHVRVLHRPEQTSFVTLKESASMKAKRLHLPRIV